MEINVNNNNPPDFAERLLVIEARGELMQKEMVAQREAMAINTAMTADVHELLMYARTGINAIGKFGRGLATIGRWVRTFFIWTTPIAVGAVAIYHGVAAMLHWKTGP